VSHAVGHQLPLGQQPGPLEEQTACGCVQQHPWIRAHHRHLQRAHVDDPFTIQAERAAAGGEDAQPGGGAEQLADQGGGGVFDMLAVVDDEPGRRRAQDVVEGRA
jgi:hypothetical protein